MEDNLIDPLVIVSVLDPAIDRVKTDIRGEDGYAATRDMDRVFFLPGLTPVRFHLRALGTGELGFIESANTAREKFLRCVVMGLTHIENHPGFGGQTMRPSTSIPDRRGGDRMVWTDAQLDGMRRYFGMALLDEIGVTIYSRMFRGNGWSGSGEPYTLPQSALEGLAAIERRSVASTPKTAGTETKGASPE